jgi:hypothetical protein
MYCDVHAVGLRSGRYLAKDTHATMVGTDVFFGVGPQRKHFHIDVPDQTP